MRRFKEWMFSVREGERSTTEVIVWWELRRIPYNLIVGAIGLISLLLFYFFISKTNALNPGEDAVEPIALLAAPVVMNICYTAGWVFEGFLDKPHSGDTELPGPKMLRYGLTLSLFVVIFPTLFLGSYWLLQVVGLIK